LKYEYVGVQQHIFVKKNVNTNYHVHNVPLNSRCILTSIEIFLFFSYIKIQWNKIFRAIFNIKFIYVLLKKKEIFFEQMKEKEKHTHTENE